MNNIDGKTLEEILNPAENISKRDQDIDADTCFCPHFKNQNAATYNNRSNSATDLANSLAKNMTSNLLFLSILAGDKIKL
jgi:hypothetical protein